MTEATAKVSRTVDAPVEEVWDALIHPEPQSYFMGAKVRSDFRVGSPIHFKGEFKGKKYEDKGEILEALPNRRLSFSHYSAMSGAPDTPEIYHVVTIELEPRDNATQVTLMQSNLKGGAKRSDIEHRAEFEKTWRSVLESLSTAVAH